MLAKENCDIFNLKLPELLLSTSNDFIFKGPPLLSVALKPTAIIAWQQNRLHAN